MTFFYFLAAIKVIFLNAVYGRLDGGGIAKVSEWVERSLIMFFFVLACAPFAGLWALFAYVGVVGIATGHGQYFLARVLKGLRQTKERVDPLVTLVFGKDWRVQFDKDYKFSEAEIHEYHNVIKPKLYWRCVFGMFVTGTLVGLPALVIAIVFGAWIPAVCFALTGVAKAVAYVVGDYVFHNTESAEYINGGLRGALCLVAIASYVL